MAEPDAQPLARTEAYVTAAAFAARGGGMAAALGDGRVLIAPAEAGAGAHPVAAHDGAVLDLIPAPDGSGWLAGGDDSRLSHIGPDGTVTPLADFGRAWVEAVAASAASGAVAVAAGKRLHVFDRPRPAQAPVAPGVTRATPTTATDIAFDPKGRRVAASHYGGVTLHWARAVDAEPRKLARSGPNLRVTWSPGGDYVVAALQENALHGWRLSDGANMAMRGYDAKVKSLAWIAGGRYLATGGLDRVICWPFTGRGGPMEQQPVEIGGGLGARVTTVAARPRSQAVIAGFGDGAVLVADPRRDSAGSLVRTPGGGPISALAASPDGRHAVAGTETGELDLLSLPGGGGRR